MKRAVHVHTMRTLDADGRNSKPCVILTVGGILIDGHERVFSVPITSLSDVYELVERLESAGNGLWYFEDDGTERVVVASRVNALDADGSRTESTPR